MEQKKSNNETNNKSNEQKSSSDTIKNAHASGDGALGTGDHLMVPDPEETLDDKNEQLRKEAEEY